MGESGPGVISSLLVVAGGWTLLTGVGLVVLGLLPPEVRGRLLPAAPVVGVALLVTVLHWTTLLMSVRLGLVVVAGVLVALAAVATRRRGRDAWRVSRRDVVALLVTAAVGTGPMLLAIAPALSVGGGVVMPTASRDAFYYVSVGTWLVDHPASDVPVFDAVPQPGDDVPANASARVLLITGMRLGESLVQAALSTALGVEFTTAWYPLLSLWVLLLVASVTAALRLLRLGTASGVLVGLAAGVSPVLLRQVFNQNAHSLLGIALAPLAIVALTEVVSRRPGVPRWFAALLLVGWLGTYTEYAVLGIPALVVATFLRPPPQWRGAVLAGVVTVVAALAMAPLVWTRALDSLRLLTALPTGQSRSLYLDASAWEVLNRVTGASVPEAGALPSRLSPFMVAAVVAGLVLAVGLGPRRPLWVGIIASCALNVLRLSVGPDRDGYTQQRLVEIGLPLVVVAAGVGWSALAVRGVGAIRAAPVGSSRRRRWLAAVVVVVVVVAIGWTLVNMRSAARTAAAAVADPGHVDGAYAEAARWVDELGGREGEDVTVLASDFEQQLWIAQALQHQADVAYPVLDASYFIVERHWAGERDRFVLADSASLVDADAGVVVRENARFRLLDMSRGEAVVATTLGFSLGHWNAPEPGPSAWMADDGRLLVWRSDGAGGSVGLRLAANPDLAPMTVQVRGEGVQPVVRDVPARPILIRVPLPDQPGVLLVLDNEALAAPAASVGDFRALSVKLTGVVRVP